MFGSVLDKLDPWKKNFIYDKYKGGALLTDLLQGGKRSRVVGRMILLAGQVQVDEDGAGQELAHARQFGEVAERAVVRADVVHRQEDSLLVLLVQVACAGGARMRRGKRRERKVSYEDYIERGGQVEGQVNIELRCV